MRIASVVAESSVAVSKKTASGFFSFSDSNTISNLNNENHIAGAVGFVVCGVHVVEADGSQGDVPFSTGSAFLVSANGHLLTNKHVAAVRWDMPGGFSAQPAVKHGNFWHGTMLGWTDKVVCKPMLNDFLAGHGEPAAANFVRGQAPSRQRQPSASFCSAHDGGGILNADARCHLIVRYTQQPDAPRLGGAVNQTIPFEVGVVAYGSEFRKQCRFAYRDQPFIYELVTV